MEENETRKAGAAPEETAEAVAAQATPPEADPLSPAGEAQPPVQKATTKQRIVAAVAAVVVIFITLIYTYSIYTGALFSR